MRHGWYHMTSIELLMKAWIKQWLKCHVSQWNVVTWPLPVFYYCCDVPPPHFNHCIERMLDRGMDDLWSPTYWSADSIHRWEASDIYWVICLVRPNQSIFWVGLRLSGHHPLVSPSSSFSVHPVFSWMFPRTVPAETTSSLSPFHLFITLCEKKNFLISSLKLSFANFFECPLVLSELSTRKNEFHEMADNPLEILNNSTRSERFLLSSRDITEHFISFVNLVSQNVSDYIH